MFVQVCLAEEMNHEWRIESDESFHVHSLIDSAKHAGLRTIVSEWTRILIRLYKYVYTWIFTKTPFLFSFLEGLLTPRFVGEE